MKKHKTENGDQQWFDNQIGKAVKRFDDVHEPSVPELHAFEQLVHEHKREVKRKLWKELMLFWLAACFIFGFMMWIVDRNWVWFAVFQSAIAAGGIVFAGMTFGKRVGREWNR
ncbi:YxlC family protein [Paenibacillus prosopidis]|uniref:DUF2335 domain-containing protein n=1 Tax=Paenibacillus prosopidis TaxID=630520 RepID=A0A368VQG9_9BACL|nr:YxlC family protein [Paenibacillus prosopidis]RCW44150.1 hypothetical protein DFP97_11213 [Paenibacillus prosopidis]